MRSNKGSLALTESAIIAAIMGVALMSGFALFLSSAQEKNLRDSCIAEDVSNAPSASGIVRCLPIVD